jgi:hypothetical protein
MDKSVLIKPFDKGVAARTNMLKITDNQEQLIKKLIIKNSGVGAIDFSRKPINREKNEEAETYYRRVDSEIKLAIIYKLNLKNNEPVNYDRLSVKNNYLFFFVSENGCSSDDLLDTARKYGFDLEKIVQTLLSLRLKLAYLEDLATDYEIKPALYNARLYVGAIKTKEYKNGDFQVEALKLNLYFSKQNEIALSLSKKLFKCVYEDNFIPATHDSCLFFHHKSKALRVEETLDARKAKRPYMAYSQKEGVPDFGKYENCINYHLTVSLNKLITVLSKAGVNFSPIEFKANYIVSEFIKSDEQYSNPLIIIDTFSSYETEESRIWFRDYLKQTFGAKCVISVEDAPKPEELQTDGVNYLVINEAKKKNGSSIIRLDKPKVFNNFFQALAVYEEDSNANFDYYTNVKIHRFLNKLPSVTQGENVEKIEELDENVVKKIKTELWLKERVLHHRSINGIKFPHLELVLFFVRRPLKNKQTYIAVVDVTTSESGLKVTDYKRYDSNDKGKFDRHYDYLKRTFSRSTDSCIDALYNGGFYLYDKMHQKLLSSYNSDGVPNVIGNAAFDNVERSKIADSFNRKIKLSENCVLPYYLNRTKNKQNYYIFLEDCKQQEVVRYFLSKKGDTARQIAKQNKMQNILVFNDNGDKAQPLEEELTVLFLQSFTFNIFNNNEVSKKSIFQKVAEMYIEN